MAHLSWYRKYRPQTFDDVVGQTHIERTLRNAVSEGTVAHAYLFTGPRGTGKTTTARILAKALNCEKGPTADPDDTCEQCVAISEGTHPDVHELDAASRTGVDDVREQIIGRVNYAPSRGTWKIYIIDEVQMLSPAAFNALLKTIEEPPGHTVFILCTTHPHKIPETIHSRCQHFDFHRLSVEDIVGRLRVISDAEGVKVPDGALAIIAKHALGGMRDAITTLEQLASFGGGTISVEDVEGLLGDVDTDLLFQAAELVLDRDVAGAFRFVARLAEAGVDMSEFVKGMVRHFRDLFVIAAVGADGAVDTTADDRGRLDSQAARFGSDRIARVLELLGRVSTELRYASDQRLAVEVALTRMARPQGDITLESLAERLDALEAGTPLKDVVIASTSPAPLPDEPRSSRAEKPETAKSRPVAEKSAQDADEPARSARDRGTLDVKSVKRAWPAVLAEFKKLKPSRSQLFNGTEAEVDGEVLVVEFPADQEMLVSLAEESETLSVLRRSVATVLGTEPLIEYRLGRSGGSTEAPVLVAPADTVLEASVIAELGAELIDDVTHEE
ncbi:MAG: DNA polymerase III subunit gamma/tau [Coriobacteriia bacterium]|nr:DNA polymerase III subunit gamma/tau [Coriobacteriia bacterium]